MRRLPASLLGAVFALLLVLPAAAAEPVFPDSYHVRLPMRLDQGGEPQCVVFAGSLALGSILGGEYSTVDAWRYLVRRGEASSLGTMPNYYLDYAKNVGVLPVTRKADRIYRAWRQPDKSAKGFHYERRWSNRPARYGGPRVRITDYVRVDDNDPYALQAAILQYGPLLVTLAWDTAWDSTRLDGTMRPPTGNIRGIHEIVIFGYKHINGVLYWDVANSYGEFWGYKGVGFMADAYRDFGDTFAVIP